MTTKPKAKKFRIRRSPASAQDDGAAAAKTPVPPAAGQPAASGAAPMEGQVASARETSAEAEIDAIRREGLTGRQLRMARRVAQKHNLAVTSDFDAVRVLRSAGIDPFQRSNMLELVVDGANAQQQAGAAQPQGGQKQALGKIQLPQTMPKGETLPSTDSASPAERRNREISEIQRDISRRRRRKMFLLMTRLAFFVMLPTIIAGYYFNFVATPMYSTKSEFLILKSESSGSAMGGLFSGTQFATNQDAIAVQSYLQSKDAMLRLDQDVGFKSHYTQEWIDPIQRLSENPTNEEAYKMFKRNISIGYDPTEGVIKMEVSAADPEMAASFSQELLRYAEERVDNLSRRMRLNSLEGAQDRLEKAKLERRAAQENLVRLQQEGAILDPEGKITQLRAEISNFELQLREKQLALQALLDNRRPNQAKVDGARADIRRLEDLLKQLNAEMTQSGQGEDSLAQLAANISLAQSDLASADLLLQSSLDQLQSAQREANSQVRYLTTSVQPVASEDPSYPRKFENTLLAFLIFAGSYLMISLTASILREQVNT